LTVVAVISPGEFDFTAFDIDDPMIRDGHAVGVAADVIQHLLWSGEWWFGVDDPFHVSYQIEVALKSLSISQGPKRGEEVQLARVEAQQTSSHPKSRPSLGT
jgi:hypothetical protein